MPDLYGLIKPLLQPLSPERAHNLALWALERGLVSGAPYLDPVLSSTLWGLAFPNPVGLAAGFDKDATAPIQTLALGFGFVEIGSVTPKSQPGNPKPRLFRLEDDQGVINRMGFNSKGMAHAAAALARLPRPHPGVIGVNLGKNKKLKTPRRTMSRVSTRWQSMPITWSSTCRHRTRLGCARCNQKHSSKT